MAIQMTSSHADLLQPSWSSLSGQILDGGFELQELLEADEAQARFKVRVLGDRELDCVALLFQVDGAGGERQVELWSLTRQFRHPNVSAPLGAGRLKVDGVVAIYAVVRRADESLDSVLSERALTVSEAGDALKSVARALEVLHLNELVYGCLAPSRVLAVGESIQLPAECARATQVSPVVRVFAPAYLAPESQGENVTTASDLWCLGATLFEALTQKAWTEECREETGALPEPFASIALRCLHTDPKGRANLGEVMALFRGELKLVPRVRAAAAGAATTMIVPETDLGPRRVEAPIGSSPAGLEKGLEGVSGKPVPTPPPSTVALPTASPATTPLASAPFATEAQPSVPLPTVTQAGPITEKQVAEKRSAPEQPVTVGLASTPVSSPEENQLVSPPPFLVRSPSDQAGARTSFEEKLFRSPGPSRPGFDKAARDVSAGTSRSLEGETREPSTNLWIWAGLTLVVVIGLIWALRPKAASIQPTPASTASVSHPKANASAPAQPAKGGSGDKAWQTRTLEPDGSTPRPTTPVPAAAVPAKSPVTKSVAASSAPAKSGKSAAGVFTGASGDVWRVVAFTYSRQPDAENRVKAINAKHGNLHAGLFSPSGSGAPFLVVLGDWMSREEAAQIRRKAVASGLPHDSYIQNFTK